jgi:hypothetical protein
VHAAEYTTFSNSPAGFCCIDVSTNSFAPGSNSYPNQLINSSVPFTALVLAQIPAGVSFEIDIA